MTTATQAKTTTVAPPEPAPQREWQVGDRVRGQHPKTHLLHTGIFQKQGYKYMTLHSPGGTTPILAETAELLTAAEDVVELPCPFAEDDLLDYQGQRWEAGKNQKTPLLTWRVVLIDPEPGAGWHPEYLEWPCDEDCPAVAVAAPAIAEAEPDEPIAPPAFDSEPFESVEHYLGSAILWQENEEFICPDDEPIAYRGWQIITDSLEGHLNSFSAQTPDGQWYSGLTLDGPLSALDRDEAIAYAKATIDNAIALAQKLSDQMSLLEQPAVEAEIVATDPTARLTELEADITEGLGLIEQGKAKIWAAVEAVRSEELWRVAGHPTFEAYCAERWNWKKANGHENALAGEVLKELLLSGVPVEAVPTSTSAMSQLAKAPAGDRAEALQKAATLNGGKVTEAAVRQALKPEPSTEAELRSAGIPVYKPDTSEAAIAEGLERGDIAFTETAIAATVSQSELESFAEMNSALALTSNKIVGLFDWDGRQWVATGDCSKGFRTLWVEAREVVPASQWQFPSRTYAEICDGPKPINRTGQLVALKGQKYVLTQNTAKFIPRNPPSHAAFAHAAATPDDDAQSRAEAPPPAVEASRRSYEVGRKVRVADRPGLWTVAQHAPADACVMVWCPTGKYLAHPDELTAAGPPDAGALELTAQAWLFEMVSVLGPERVRSLLGEVVK